MKPMRNKERAEKLDINWAREKYGSLENVPAIGWRMPDVGIDPILTCGDIAKLIIESFDLVRRGS